MHSMPELPKMLLGRDGNKLARIAWAVLSSGRFYPANGEYCCRMR